MPVSASLWVTAIELRIEMPTVIATLLGHRDQGGGQDLLVGTIGLSLVALMALVMAIAAHPRIRPGSDAPDPRLGIMNIVLVVLALALSLAVPAHQLLPAAVVGAGRPAVPALSTATTQGRDLATC